MKAKLGILLLLLCVVSYFMYEKKEAQKKAVSVEKLIHGKVIDFSNKAPIGGVSIALEGYNPELLSNAQGEYAIITLSNQNLVFRHKDYKTLVLQASEANIVIMEPIDSSEKNEELSLPDE